MTWGTLKPQPGFGEFIAKENTQALSGYSSVVLQHGEILLGQPKYEAWRLTVCVSARVLGS